MKERIAGLLLFIRYGVISSGGDDNVPVECLPPQRDSHTIGYDTWCQISDWVWEKNIGWNGALLTDRSYIVGVAFLVLSAIFLGFAGFARIMAALS